LGTLNRRKADINQQTAGERFGIKGRRTIRKAPPGQNATGSYVGLWDIQGKPGSTVHRLEQVYLAALNGVDSIEARKAEALKSGRFTPDGARADALQFAAQQLSPVFHRGKHQIAAAKREAAELRSKVKLQPTDKTDLVSAMLRAEMRDFMRSKPQAERDAYIRENADNLDPQMALAVMEVPAELSGISIVQRDALIERALEAQHGDALKEVQELERSIELAERAVQLGRDEIIRESEADAHEFNVLAEPFEKAAGANWLKKYQENGQEVIRVMKWDGATKTFTAAKATPEEIADGAFYNNFEEYRLANGLSDERTAA
jgi:hypothetical protein